MPPSASMMRLVSTAASRLMSTATTFAPSRAKSTAVALPLPHPGPLQRARRFRRPKDLTVRQYPHEMATATLLYFFYLFTWIGWSAWMPQFLANEKHLGFQTAASYLSIWMFCAIFAYYLCGWLSDLFGRRYVIPAFCIPAAILLVVMGQLDSATGLFWVGLILNFLITGSFGAGLGYNTELFPTQ